MRSRSRSRLCNAGALLVAGFVAWGCGGEAATGPPSLPPPPPPPAGPALAPPLGLELVADNVASPTYLDAPPGDPRLFVAERDGVILLFENGVRVPTPFLNLENRVARGGRELGLFSFAFHPEFSSNGLLYVAYSDRDTALVVERYEVSADPDVADLESAIRILRVGHPVTGAPRDVHFGGQVRFAPDGLLYVSVGDGSLGFDPLGNGQNPDRLLGSLLRLDVDAATPFAIPPGNPFADDPEGRDEIWAIGLRNPWRFSFDPVEDLLYLVDVGENMREEVNVQDFSLPGLNYGWRTMEGSLCFPAAADCDRSGLTLPTLEYSHAEGCAVVGGEVYRGGAIRELVGAYLYADVCEGWLRSFRLQNGRVTEEAEWTERRFGGQILGIGTDGEGEPYVLTTLGIWKIVPRTSS